MNKQTNNKQNKQNKIKQIRSGLMAIVASSAISAALGLQLCVPKLTRAYIHEHNLASNKRTNKQTKNKQTK